MWKRLRRRTMGPSRPAVFTEQLPLLLVTLLVLGGSVALVVGVLLDS